MKSVEYIGSKTITEKFKEWTKQEKVPFYKCIFCGKEFKGSGEYCSCEKALIYKTLRSKNICEQYKLENAKYFICRSGKHTVHIFENIKDYNKFLDDKEFRKQVQLERERKLQSERDKQLAIYAEESRVRQAERDRLEKLRLIQSDKALKNASLKEMIEALFSLIQEYRYNDDYCGNGYKTAISEYVHEEDLISYIKTNYEDLLHDEINRIEQERSWDE